MTECRYYAVTDPDHPELMTYWREKKGRREAWPAKARYHPVLYRADVPSDPVQRQQVIDDYHASLRDWRQRLDASIDADPVGAAQRFAQFATRCCCCARKLTDERSKVYGIGPECRSGLTPETLATFYVPRVAIAHGAADHEENT